MKKWLTGAAVFLLVSQGAWGAAYKCKDASGQTTYSDKPCVAFSQKGEKIFDRGAGYNALDDDEKRAFINGVTRNCMARRGVGGTQAQWEEYCSCSAKIAAENVKIEDVKAVNNPKDAHAQDKMRILGEEAGKSCVKHLDGVPRKKDPGKQT